MRCIFFAAFLLVGVMAVFGADSAYHLPPALHAEPADADCTASGGAAAAAPLRLECSASPAVVPYEKSAGNPDDGNSGVFQRIQDWRLRWIGGTDAWLYTGHVGSYVQLQDTRMSPLVYSGPGIGPYASMEIVRERWISPTTLTARFAFPDATEVLPGSYTGVSVEGDTALLYRIPDTGFAVGGGVRGGVHLRLYEKLQNSTFNSDLIVSANAAGRWEVPFSFLSRSMRFHTRVDVPAISFVTRSPDYALYSSRSFWAPPAGFFRATVETGLTWQLRWSNENTARIAYIWDFYTMNEHDDLYAVRSASHGLSLSLGLRSL